MGVRDSRATAGAALEQLVALIADAVAARLGDRDELVALAPKPLAAMGLEHAAVLRLVAEGRLRAVTIGRRRFTKRSYLLALVDELPALQRQAERAASERNELHEAVEAMRRRSERKRMRMANGGRR